MARVKEKVKDNGAVADLNAERATRVGSALAKAGAVQAGREIKVHAPNMQTVEFKIIGAAPYMQARFAKKAMEQMRAKHIAGSKAGKGKKRDPRNFDDDYEQAKHVSTEDWCGIPAGAFRNAMISACRLCGFKMTLAKLSIFVLADGFDVVDGTPLVRLYGTPEKTEIAARNATGVIDIRVRPMWRQWHALVKVRFDGDQLSVEDVANLMTRVGLQVGIGEGRPDSRESAGLGFGLFDLEAKPNA